MVRLYHADAIRSVTDAVAHAKAIAYPETCSQPPETGCAAISGDELAREIRNALARASAEQPAGSNISPAQPAPDASALREITSLALDLETYCVNHSEEGALSPFTGEIRLMSTADVAGNITVRDLKDNPRTLLGLQSLATTSICLDS
jgi:hypothetical protein